MPLVEVTSADRALLNAALAEAQRGFDEGGVPVGAVVVEAGKVAATGHNRRVQAVDPIGHGEMDCLRRFGRRRSYRSLTLYTTLSPCMMCSGTIAQFGIPRVVVGENQNFEGNIEFLSQQGIEIAIVNDPGCIALMARFINEYPELWYEDIAEGD